VADITQAELDKLATKLKPLIGTQFQSLSLPTVP
jgi:hypothetical protein